MWCPEGMSCLALIPAPTHVQDLVYLIWHFVFVIIYLYVLSPSTFFTFSSLNPYVTFIIHSLSIFDSLFFHLSPYHPDLLSATKYSPFHLHLSRVLLQTKLMNISQLAY